MYTHPGGVVVLCSVLRDLYGTKRRNGIRWRLHVSVDLEIKFAVCFVECFDISVTRTYVCVWCVAFIAPCFQRNVAVST